MRLRYRGRAMHPAGPLADPPAGAPWDVDFARCPFALLDCEMTGPSPDRDALVEIAVTRVEGGRVVDAFASRVRSEVPSSPGALALHGLDATQLADAPAFAEVAPRVAALLEGAVPVAHGFELDQAFLARAFAAEDIEVTLPFMLDTVQLARRAVHAHGYGLAAVCAKLSLGAWRWHRAEEDVRAVHRLFEHLVGVFRPSTARELWEVRVGQHGPVRVRASLEAFFTRYASSGRPVTLQVRTPGHDPTSLVARIDRYLRPHLHLTLGARGRRPTRVLRADRVLRAEDGAAPG